MLELGALIYVHGPCPIFLRGGFANPLVEFFVVGLFWCVLLGKRKGDECLQWLLVEFSEILDALGR